MLVHRFAASNGSTSGAAVGGHAFSTDGLSWTYALQPCYTTRVRWANGSSTSLYRRERPKPLLMGGRIAGLFNGAWPCHFGREDDDSRDAARGCASFTIFTALRASLAPAYR